MKKKYILPLLKELVYRPLEAYADINYSAGKDDWTGEGLGDQNDEW